jgi:two-component system, sporulation sensor kinase B
MALALLTKDLLINLLFLVIMCIIANISIGFLENKTKYKILFHSMIGGIAIFGCITFGVQVNADVIFDLRQIPFIIVGLMEGPIVALILLVFTVLSRSIFGGDGIYATIIVYSLLTMFVIKLSPRYLTGRFIHKLIISIFLSLFSSIVMISSLRYLGYSIWKSGELWMSYIFIPAFGMILLQIITEGIRRYFLLRNEIFKAEKIQMISNLAASFGHEVRNPICVSKGFLQLLSEDGISIQKKKEYVQTALLELDRAEKIIYNYLTFAKPQLEDQEFLNLKDEIKQAIEIVLPMANMSNVIVKTVQTPHTFQECTIEGERNRLHQCLLNLLKNAIEAMPNGGTLIVEILNNEKFICLQISDTGVGMTKDQIQRLGEPYYSLKEKGTGLGMMVVYSIIKAMKGSIKVQSEMGKGTTFTINFPKQILPTDDYKKYAS